MTTADVYFNTDVHIPYWNSSIVDDLDGTGRARNLLGKERFYGFSGKKPGIKIGYTILTGCVSPGCKKRDMPVHLNSWMNHCIFTVNTIDIKKKEKLIVLVSKMVILDGYTCMTSRGSR